MKIISLLQGLGITGFLDITFMSLLIYSVLVWFKKTKAAFVLTGILIIAGVYILAREFNLLLTATVFQGFFAVILVAVIVIFQEELRHFFEQVAVWSLNRRLTKRESMRLSHPEVETLVRTAVDLSREKVGALIIIRGKDMIIRYLNGGVDLDGTLSEHLLKSLLDPHSIGHDGAVVIERGRITKFSSFLPLSKNLESIKHTGTRHAAALGLAEATDAFCIIVSEERGNISVAHEGVIKKITSGKELSLILDKFYQEIRPIRVKHSLQDFFVKNSREKIIALGVAVALWFTLVYGSRLVYKTYTVPIKYSVLPSTMTVRELYPNEVDVTLSGSHRAFYFFDRKHITVFLKLWNLEKGSQKIKISGADLLFPKKFVFEGIEPPAVRVFVEQQLQNRKESNNLGQEP